MNRKLQHTFFALSAAGLMAMVGLVAATSGALTPAPQAVHPTLAATSPAPDADPFDTRIRAFEAELADAGSTRGVVGASTALAVELAVLAAFRGEASTAADAEAVDRERRKSRRSRGAMAMPYFSFAQGLRGGNGG